MLCLLHHISFLIRKCLDKINEVNCQYIHENLQIRGINYTCVLIKLLMSSVKPRTDCVVVVLRKSKRAIRANKIGVNLFF